MRPAFPFVLCSCVLAQDRPLPRAVMPKDRVVVDPVRHDPTRVVVKLAEARPGLAAAGTIVDPDVRGVVGSRRMRPLFAGQEGALARLRARVLAATPAGRATPADLSLYFEVSASGLVDARQLLRGLNDLPQVELAYPSERPTPPPGDVSPVTPNFVPYQAYRDPAPDGIDAFAIQQLVGASGRGVTVLEIEWGWWFDHEDLAVLRPSSLVGPPSVDDSYNWHGLGVVGEIAADEDLYGVSGLTPEIDLLVATSYPAAGYSVAAAVVAGLPYLDEGDVIMIAAQTTGPLGLVPTEWNQADFDAIQNATRLGVIVLETGANGAVDLDDRRLHRAFDLRYRDSGAIIVGASHGRARERAWFSSYGSRIDGNGWGLDVVTTGFGDLFAPGQDRRQTYTMAFSGTSSATPMLTAAVVALRGAAMAQLEPDLASALDVAAIRDLLRRHGTAMEPPDQGIGLRPDMRKLLRAANLERGLRLRQRPRLGQTVEIELAPANSAPGDAWLLAGAAQPANLGLDPPFTQPYCDRLLLDPASLRLFTEGVFATWPTVLRLPIPAEPTLQDQHYYLQAVTMRGTGAPCTTNSVVLRLET